MTSSAITTTNTTGDITPATSALEAFARAADKAADESSIEDFRRRKSANTLRAQDNDLTAFTDFITGMSKAVAIEGALNANVTAWKHITHGIVKAFIQSQLNDGYSISTINRQLATIKRYAKIAHVAGAIKTDVYAKLRDVTGYTAQEAKRINDQRPDARVGSKKAESVELTVTQANALKRNHPNTPQGRRDAVIMCILADHGLRCGEIALLDVNSIEWGNSREDTFIVFSRPKVGKEDQRIVVSPDTYRALKAYFNMGDVVAAGKLLRGSRKNGQLTDAGMSERQITDRVKVVGERVGVNGLSAHDLRHYAATRYAARRPDDLFGLQEMGGWSSLQMPRRYVARAAVANTRQTWDE